MINILINPMANNKAGGDADDKIKDIFSGQQAKVYDVREIIDYPDFISNLSADDIIVLAGGDGTLNHFINDIKDTEIKNKLYLYPTGSGNDFFRDVKETAKLENSMLPLNEYIKDLPIVKVNGMEKKFLNGIGFGIDGYVCAKSDDIRANSDKAINYTSIALKGLIHDYKPCNALVTVDGVLKSYSNVWLAPSMLGRYYGGGMKITPNQDRKNKQRTLTNCVLFTSSKLDILTTLPGVYEGKHIKATNIVEFRTGHEITVEYTNPQDLQIDGETINDVTSYTVYYR